jgi:LPXTG-motif cell wall-anchored protein
LGTSTVVVTNSTFDNFNKNGIHLIGAGITATITNSTFTGNNNASNAAAQNGIVFMNGATGLVTGCTFTDFSYPVPAVATATGVLAYDAGAGITLRNNKFINDQDPVDNVTDNNTTPPAVDATMNYWGSATPDFATLITSDYVTHATWYTDTALTKLNNAVYGVTLDKTASTVHVGDTLTLAATVDAGADASKTVTWASSDDKVAKVDSSGHVTATGLGSATITATAGTKSASYKVTVVSAEVNISDNTTPLGSNPLSPNPQTGDKGTAVPLIIALSSLFTLAGVTLLRKKAGSSKN